MKASNYRRVNLKTQGLLVKVFSAALLLCCWLKPPLLAVALASDLTMPGTGQDGTHNINPLSYTDNGNGTITDNTTGLVWQEEADNTGRTWAAAGTYCNNMTLGGQSDWRLPTKEELITLVDYSLSSPGPTINTIYFPDTPAGPYWSSTEAYLDAWYVGFDTGNIGYSGKFNDHYVRCVRGTQAAASLTDNKNNTVTDRATGLLRQNGEKGSSCSLTVLPSSQTFTSAGGTGLATVTASDTSCSWTAASSLNWVTIISGSGTGSGTATFAAQTDTTEVTRTGNITIAGQTFTITQTSGKRAGDTTTARQPFLNTKTLNAQSVYLGSSQAFFDAIQPAYDATISGDKIFIQGLTFTEALLFNQNNTVTLIGGYDSSFTSNLGAMTTTGSLTISGGAVIVDKLALQTAATGGGIAPDMSAVPVSMTYLERNTALAKAGDFWAANTTGNLDADNVALANYISALPEFADAGVSPDQTVWARFKDGRPVVFGAESGVKHGPVQTAHNMPKRIGELPQGATALLMDRRGLGLGVQDTVDPWLSRAGYVTGKSGGTMYELMTMVKDLAVFWFSTHGIFDTAMDGTRSYLLATDDNFVFRNASGIPETADELVREEMSNNGLLVRRVTGPNEYTWTITHKFVEKYWTFKPDSLIVIDACLLFNKSTPGRADIGAKFRTALAKVSNNRATIIGWDDSVKNNFARDTMTLFFDRVLGANQFNPETPPQRPFPFVSVYHWMMLNNKIKDPSFPEFAEMKLESYPQVSGMYMGQLVPTIKYATPSYTNGKGWSLQLFGDFGVYEPMSNIIVTVNGTQLSPVLADDTGSIPWWGEGVHVKLPDSMDAPGTSGDVVVEVRGHKSNVIPLTQWIGTVSQVQKGIWSIGSGANLDITCPVRMTADIHSWRTDPGVRPKIIGGIHVEVPSGCAYTLSGAWTIENSQEITVYELSGSGSTTPDPNYYNLYGYGDLSSSSTNYSLPIVFDSSLNMNLLRSSITGTLKATTTSKLDGTTNSISNPVGAYWSGGAHKVTLDANYKIIASHDCNGIYSLKSCNETWNIWPISGVPVSTTLH